MNQSTALASVKKSIVVNATPQEAFDVFTSGMDSWWPKSHGIGSTPIKQSIIEPFVGGRWYSICEDGSQAVVGHVRAWQPGALFVVSWEINAEWKPDARAEFASEVEVRFVADAAGTRVDLEHRNFERMGAHAGEIMRNGVDQGWPGLLALFADAIDRH